MPRPTKAEVAACHGQTMPDIIAPNLDVLFCGINPSLYSVAIGHHFGRPGNRFWKALHKAGFTDRLYDPSEDASLLELGYGITNMAPRATARADELSKAEIRAGRQLLADKIQTYRPKCIAFLGITAYRLAFSMPKAKVGPQPDWKDTQIWALPNPSGLNAHYQVDDLAEVYSWALAAVEQ
ncbi:Uracil DNA glycosylase superfamily [Synechococcus sp. PCC 7335]|uniref:G/U mismatch-specific DNA glycosylase n=1 Tax=Synechococcus sp. (strain ATCC 29403 / PCC 7335) TaxID=91464 RepID=UPI00017EB847|nr:G/U mismatch-specific DNA glycosylase [Synechococcus sp. PCC 7335]EDX87739.1 Uracil DNA glycosylase superfamily [Synechococcus sp. PCC 7335]